MNPQIVKLECPGCATPLTTETTVCPSCFRPIVISSFRNVEGMSIPDLNQQTRAYEKVISGYPNDTNLNMSLAFCYLKLKLYDRALPCFEKAMDNNPDHSEVYFYAAVPLFKGKKAFLATHSTIDKAEAYLNAAISMEPRGIYFYFLSYIKYDYYSRKYLNTSPTYQEALKRVGQNGVSESDIQKLYTVLGISQPSCL